MMREIRDTIPAFCAYFPLGILFGHIFVTMGYPWYLAPIMSAVVYGGSVQFLCLSLLAAGSSLFEIVLGGLLLSLRNFFYGFSFLDRRERSLFSHLYLMFGLVDATYSILIVNKENGKKYATRVNWMIHSYWIIGTLLGSVINVTDLPYMDFALPAFFTCLAIELWKWKPACIAVLSAVLAMIILPSQFLLIATVISAGLLNLFPSKMKAKT